MPATRGNNDKETTMLVVLAAFQIMNREALTATMFLELMGDVVSCAVTSLETRQKITLWQLHHQD